MTSHVPKTVLCVLLLIGCDGGAPRLHGRGAERPIEHHEVEAPVVAARPEPRVIEPGQIAPRVVDVPSAEAVVAPAGEPSREGWNEAQIDWQPYEEGLAAARRTARPILLALSATWCGHCRTYSHVFEDPRVVVRAQRFVMVHVDSDVQRDVAARYVLDGSYVPRTYFLAPDGAPMADVTASHPRFHYFFDENDPASLVAGMDAALVRVGG